MFYDTVKRILDTVFSFLLLIFFSPVILVSAILIKLDSEGPVFADTPKRVGKDGKLFKMYKFRSMVKNAHDVLLCDPKYKKLYEEYKRGGYKLKGDPRITRVGKFIRKYSIDEVPQFFNVIKAIKTMVERLIIGIFA